MLKRMIPLLFIIPLLVGCHETAGINTWFLAEQNTAEGRIGYRITQNTEAGLSGTYLMDGSQSGIVGLYGIVRYPDPIKIPNPLSSVAGPQEFDAVGYIGLQMSADIDGARTWTGWLAGGVIQDLLVIEYLSVDYSDAAGNTFADDQQIRVGLKIEIP